jgi:hypothetical protein
VEIMAKPTGAIEPSDFGYDITSAASTRANLAYRSRLYIVVKSDLQPSEWATANREDLYQKQTISNCLEVDAGGTLVQRVTIGKETPDDGMFFSVNGPVTPTNWSATQNTESLEATRTKLLPDYNIAKIKPRYIVVQIELYRNVTTALSETCKIYGMYFEATNESSYSGNDFVYFSDSIVENKINNPNDSLSSAMMRDAIANNLNALMYQARNSFSVPMFGAF